jgi:excisionase family DNA binding protein
MTETELPKKARTNSGGSREHRAIPPLVTEGVQLYTTTEVAKMFGVSVHTVRHWLTSGKIKGVKPGGPTGDWRVQSQEIERYANVLHGDEKSKQEASS